MAIDSLLLAALAALASMVGFGYAAGGGIVKYGCYSSHGSTTQWPTKPDTPMAAGTCRDACYTDQTAAGNQSFSIFVIGGINCYCGNFKVNGAYKVNNDLCSFPCPGYPTDNCGNKIGTYFWVSSTGDEPDPATDPVSSSSSASSTSSISPTSSSKLSTTSTSEASSSATAEPEKAPVNKAGIAAGAVIGVLVIIALGVGGWIFLRRRRRQQVEEEYRRSAAARGFQKPASDHRLDPGMVQRRDSVGSIADNQDYSRRILKVTNPDG